MKQKLCPALNIYPTTQHTDNMMLYQDPIEHIEREIFGVIFAFCYASAVQYMTITQKFLVSTTFTLEPLFNHIELGKVQL